MIANPTVGGDNDGDNDDDDSGGSTLMTAMTHLHQLPQRLAAALSVDAVRLVADSGITGLEPRRFYRYCFHYRPVSLSV